MLHLYCLNNAQTSDLVSMKRCCIVAYISYTLHLLLITPGLGMDQWKKEPAFSQ